MLGLKLIHVSKRGYWWNDMETLNTLRLRQNCHHLHDLTDFFKFILLNENVWISLENDISLKFVPKVRINNIPALVQIMAWRRPGDKPSSEPMMVSILTYICVTQPQWVNSWLDLWMGNPPVTSGSPSQRTSNAKLWCCFMLLSIIGCW